MNTIKTVKFPRGLLKRKILQQKFDPISRIANSFAELEKNDLIVDSVHVNEKTIGDWLLTNDNFKDTWDRNNMRGAGNAVVGHLWGAEINENTEVPDGLMEMRPENKYVNDVKPVKCCVGLDNLVFKFKKKKVVKPRKHRRHWGANCKIRKKRINKNKGLRCTPPKKPVRGKSK